MVVIWNIGEKLPLVSPLFIKYELFKVSDLTTYDTFSNIIKAFKTLGLSI